ncbi:hypothetical protein E8P82_04050 [Arthrobacter echini]|uniref:Uncharacterized protein n=1 Tax=Arthrobacter echini TaxID=1529066 RepID=A0A4S5E8Y3_9MICC|nr:hypothetical protein [Arthrobacter echini]THJ68000.1 hypothetical protein E8P82_04050 [Arthrobacter echini]
MTAQALAKSAARFSLIFAIAAVVLAVVGPFVDRNFGAGSELGLIPLSAAWDTAPGAVIVSMVLIVLVGLSVTLAAMLAVTSLVIRSAIARDRTAASERHDLADLRSRTQ